MNSNDFIFLDFETGSSNPYIAQPIQLAAVAIDGRRLEVKEEFCSDILPVFDEETCKKLGIAPLEDEALKINKKTIQDLSNAPHPKVVWQNFTSFVNKYNAKQNKYTAPIMAGFNIFGFDDIIINRMSKEYGDYDEERRKCSLFNHIHKCDIFHDVFRWFENVYNVKSLSMDSMRDILGMDKTNSHDALCDVRDGANIMIRFFKLYRQIFKTVRFRPKNKEVDLNDNV